MAWGGAGERQHHGVFFDQAGDGPGVFGRIVLGEDHHRGFGARAVFGQPDFAQIPMRVRLKGLRQLVEHVQGLVLPTPLVAGRGKGFVQGLPEAKRAVANRDIRRSRQTPRRQIDKQFLQL